MGQKATDQLRQVLVPDLQHAVGDSQTHLVTADLVLRYLQQHQLVFAEQTVRSMFAEADFKKEGGLSLGPLVAALQGRSASALELDISSRGRSSEHPNVPQVPEATLWPERLAGFGICCSWETAARTGKHAGTT